MQLIKQSSSKLSLKAAIVGIILVAAGIFYFQSFGSGLHFKSGTIQGNSISGISYFDGTADLKGIVTQFPVISAQNPPTGITNSTLLVEVGGSSYIDISLIKDDVELQDTLSRLEKGWKFTAEVSKLNENYYRVHPAKNQFFKASPPDLKN